MRPTRISISGWIGTAPVRTGIVACLLAMLSMACSSSTTFDDVSGATSAHPGSHDGALTGPATMTSADALPLRGDPVRAYSRGPLRFEPDRGQASEDFHFVTRGAGYAVGLGDDGAFFVLGETAASLGMRFVGDERTAAPRLEPLQPLPGASHHLRGAERSRWVTAVPGYRRVAYRELYPGIDAIFYGNRRRLEFDLVLEPGAEPGAVGLRFDGASDVELHEDGRLRLTAGSGSLWLHAPVAYQEADGEREPVASRYEPRADGVVGFELGAYDRSRRLIIDPVVSYSTHLGGSGDDFAFGVASDAAGNSYVVGSTPSLDFPTTPGTFSTTCTGTPCNDGFVTKLDPSGNLVFSTYIGGTDDDGLQSVVVDDGGDIYFVGTSRSNDFPLSAGAVQTVNNGSDLVIGRLSADGSTVLAATLLGGDSSEGTVQIALDDAGNAYVAGQTVSCDFPTTAGSFQDAVPACGLFHAFVAKLDATMTTLIYSTYVGGTDFSGSSPGFAIDVDGSGHAYITGFTTSLTYPTTAGAFQTSNAGGSCSTTNCSEAYVSKLAPDGSGLVYSTYLGGTGADFGEDIRVDSAGNAWVVGGSEALDFPTLAPVQAASGGGFDAFVAALDPSGSALVSSTYLGGSGDDSADAVDLAGSGNVWITGSTTSTDFPTALPVQDSNAGGRDLFISRLDPGVPALLSSSYWGGMGDDFGRDLVLAPGDVTPATGDAVVAGFTLSDDFPTINAFQGASAGGREGFVVRFGALVEVLVDIKPGSVDNPVNPDAGGMIPVAVLTTPGFDATTVIPATARFGPDGAGIAHRSGHMEDIDADGDLDLLLHFRTRATGIACGDTEAGLTADTMGGATIQGSDNVRTVGCR